MMQVLGKYTTRTQLVFHQFQLILGTRLTVGDIKADLSTFHWLLNAPASFPDKELSVAFAHLIPSSCDKVDLIQGVKCHSIVETFRIS